jgi:hypothetical protein
MHSLVRLCMIRDDQPQQLSGEESRFSQISIELGRLFNEQAEFFRNGALGQLPPAELREYEKRRERIQGLFAELRELRKSA